MTQTLNGYLKVGDGPRKVLAMSGWFGSADDWQPLVSALDTDAFTYVFFDYRGYGRSRERDGAFTFDEAAQDVLAIADHLGWDRFSLIGHSMGGVAIQRVLLAAPERIERMAGVSAVPACGSRMDDARLAGFRAVVDDVDKRAAIIAFSTGGRLSPRWSAHLARESQRNSRADAFAAYLPQWAANDFSADVAGNATPVKLFIGEHDPTLTADLMTRTWLAWYPHASLETLRNAGHYPMYETPVALATALDSWLKQSGPPL
ncbi:alpha/beta fold hydrolase [Paraburkholderia caballeronis]|uniref:alpha/beta fold hydrolase n=1 Tax=Paraburkholderia caballeronis TaxID=416943 RepID=UPI001065666F|nr:alpha/beta hydrolase [Paraburkholderia caballeronis]TDV16624.1 pimeloyl-ACP methyl ester carboxylesterase [Paraburkholderia caballeronis]TDV19020.1 pimeloyl-ACP methyl ester carboxylesterase [Paraburkholderia caballeronis]TDV27153.1 pimeloyl-ACP methyl ester carboxylesterase [Paraburkholderia caballeronis]